MRERKFHTDSVSPNKTKKDIRRLSMMYSFVGDNGDLALNELAHWQLM